jgi:hypothetical protein
VAKVNVSDLIPLLLLVLLTLAFTIGGAMVVLLIRNSKDRTPKSSPAAPNSYISSATFIRRPPCWLAIKSHNLNAVQSALGLQKVQPCSWSEGLCGEKRLFIAPPVKGWILVFGSGLPDTNEDIDSCFRFLLNLSRKLGHVQFFSASQVLQHHAWVRAEKGRVIRAYAWAGKTLWTQGQQTRVESAIGLKCLDYEENVEPAFFGQSDGIQSNVDKVPLLAACWSVDPAEIQERFPEQAFGVAGEPI